MKIRATKETCKNQNLKWDFVAKEQLSISNSGEYELLQK